MNTINNKKFRNANEAYEYLHDRILQDGVDFADTKALFNVGFYITDPMDNKIINKERNWKQEYAEAEWQWYLSGNRNISELGNIYGKIPEIWKRMADENGDVNSNYGWQWQRNAQLDMVIQTLKHYKDTRQACISIYDGKEITDYAHDTPCTYAIQFTILHGRLDMCVTMRSNDLWYGFCNDQYCFSMLQGLVAYELNVEPGVYYHFAHNMHLYNDKI
jgi:thymidylate synthase